jgi:hypothetical protein
MMTLVLALYAEGRTDERFLPIIIQRTTEQILAKHGRATVDVLKPIVINGNINHKFSTRAERILEAARKAAGYDALIVHADADFPTPIHAMNERIKPGFELIHKTKKFKPRHLVPMIPVQKTEAWMLSDPEALRIVIGTDIPVMELGLPVRAKRVETDVSPKETLHNVLRTVLAHRSRRRRRIRLGMIYEPLAQQISLERLRLVPSYAQFVHDLTQTFTALHLLA